MAAKSERTGKTAKTMSESPDGEDDDRDDSILVAENGFATLRASIPYSSRSPRGGGPAPERGQLNSRPLAWASTQGYQRGRRTRAARRGPLAWDDAVSESHVVVVVVVDDELSYLISPARRFGCSSES